MGTTEMAFAASVLTSAAAAPALEVYERAVTQADIRGQVCPAMGDSGFRASTWHGSDLSAQYGPQRIATARPRPVIGGSGFTNVQLSKPRTGYSATSGTG
jgi:hypothetical protein